MCRKRLKVCKNFWAKQNGGLTALQESKGKAASTFRAKDETQRDLQQSFIMRAIAEAEQLKRLIKGIADELRR